MAKILLVKIFFFFRSVRKRVSFQHSYINFSGLGEAIHDVDLYDGLLL